MDEATGTPKEVDVEDDSDDDLVWEIKVPPPPCEYNFPEVHENDPQWTLRNLTKFQASLRECSRFAVVSYISSTSIGELIHVSNLH